MIDETAECARWKSRLEVAAASTPGSARAIVVLPSIGSTQDAARRHGLTPGLVITTLRQTAGRGRFGRSWCDTGADGLAMTFVVDRDRPQRLAIAGAVAAAKAIERTANVNVGIKWPNDVLAPDGRKVAGVLIEQTGEFAIIGIGINVLQRHWPAELDGRAASLLQLGVELDRAELAAGLLRSVEEALRAPDSDLVREFAARDVLTGGDATLRAGGEVISGRIVRIDPMRGLAVACPRRGEVWIAAETATIEQWGAAVS